MPKDSGTHTPFSFLVTDDTLLKPRLEADTLARDPLTVHSEYKRMILSLHEAVKEALGLKTAEGDVAGLHGEQSGEFDIDKVISNMTGHKVEGKGETYPDFLVKTVNDNNVPDRLFIAFVESKTLYGPTGTGRNQHNDEGYREMQATMKKIDDDIQAARNKNDDAEVERLRSIRATYEADFRAGEIYPADTSSEFESTSKERARNTPRNPDTTNR